MSDIHRRASDVRAKHLLGFQGLVVEDDRNVERPFHNALDQVTHVVSIAVSGASGTDAVQIVLSGRADLADVTFSFTTSSSASTNALAAAEIVDAFNASAEYTAFAWASLDGSSVVLTSVGPGTYFSFTATATSSDVTLTATITAGADPAAAPFGSVIAAQPATPGAVQNQGSTPGSPMLSVSSDYGRSGPRVGELIGGIPVAALATQTQVVGTVGAANNTDVCTAIIELDGALLFVPFTATAAPNTTATAAATAINGLSGVSCTPDSATFTVKADEIGASLSLTVVGTAGTTVTVGAVSGKFNQRFLMGIAAYKPTLYDTKIIGEAATGVPAGETGILLEEGYFLAKITGTASDGAYLYVGTAGSERGKLFASSSSDRIAWHRCKKVAAARDGFVLCRLLPLAV